MGALHESQYTVRIISRSVLPKMRNVWDKSCRKHQNVHFVFNNFFLRQSCRLWDSLEKYDGARQATGHSIIGRRKVAIGIPDNWGKDTDTHSEYLILLLHIWLIPYDFVTCFTATPTKLRNCVMTYPSLRSVQPNCGSKEDHEQMNILLSQCSMGNVTLSFEALTVVTLKVPVFLDVITL